MTASILKTLLQRRPKHASMDIASYHFNILGMKVGVLTGRAETKLKPHLATFQCAFQPLQNCTARGGRLDSSHLCCLAGDYVNC